MALGTRVLYELVGVDRASPAFDKAGRSASGLERTISRVGKSVAVAGGMIGAAAVVIGVESVKSATAFQSSMEKIRTQAGASQKSVATLSSEVLRLHAQQGPQQLADSLFHLKSVGLDDALAMKALRTSSDLAAVGGANLEDVTNALAGAWRSGIKGASDFGVAAATMNAIIGAGNMRMQDLADAMGTGFLSTARTFGLSLKSVGSALALMTDEGTPAQAAATRLRMSISLLGAPSAAAEKQLGSIGVTGLMLANAMRGPQGLIGAISLLKSHLDASGLSASRQAELLSHAFGGGRSSAAILLMVNQLDVLRKKQDQINATTSQYGGDVAAQRKTAQAQFALLRSSLDVIGVRIGSALLPPVTRFTAFLASALVPAAVKAGAAVGRIIPVAAIERDVKSATGLIGDFLSGFSGLFRPAIRVKPRLLPSRLPPQIGRGLVTPAFSPGVMPRALLPGVPPQAGRAAAAQAAEGMSRPAGISAARTLGSTLSTALRTLDWSAIFKTMFSGAGGVVTTIGNGILEWFSQVNWLKVGAQAAMIAIPVIVGFVNNLAAAIISTTIHHPLDVLAFVAALIPAVLLAGALGKVFGDIPVLGKLVTAFGKPLELAGAFVEKTFGKVFGSAIAKAVDFVIPGARGKLADFLDLAWTFIGSKAIDFYRAGTRLMEGLSGGLTGARDLLYRDIRTITEDWLIKPFSRAGGWLAGKGRDFIGGFRSGAQSAARGIGGWLGDHVVSPVTGRFARAGSWLYGRGSDLIAGLRNGAWSVARSIGSWLGDHVVSPVTSRFSRAGTWLYGRGKDLASGLLSGIRAVMANIGGWVKSHIVDPVVSAVKHFFGIHSPSTVMAGLGGHLITGLMQGLARHDGAAIAKKIFGSLPAALGHIVEKGLISLASLPGRAMSALGSLGSTIGGFFSSLFGGGGAGAGVKQWSGDVLKALSMLGLPASYLPLVLDQMQSESGGNPRAINLTDINARMGDPSRGLMQTIMTTFDTWAGPFRGWGIYNPFANIYAALNYAKHGAGFGTGPGQIGSMHGYALGTGSASPGWHWVGETGPELMLFRGGEKVVPGRGASRAPAAQAAPPSRQGPLVHVEHLNVREEADMSLIAGKLNFAIISGSLGG